MTIVPTTISVVSFLSYQIQKWRRATNECIMVGRILKSLQNSLKFELWVSLQEGYIEVVPVMANFASQELFNAQKVLYETCELKTEPNRKPLRLAHKNDREDMIMIPEVIIQIISQPEKQCIIG